MKWKIALAICAISTSFGLATPGKAYAQNPSLSCSIAPDFKQDWFTGILNYNDTLGANKVLTTSANFRAVIYKKTGETRYRFSMIENGSLNLHVADSSNFEGKVHIIGASRYVGGTFTQTGTVDGAPSSAQNFSQEVHNITEFCGRANISNFYYYDGYTAPTHTPRAKYPFSTQENPRVTEITPMTWHAPVCEYDIALYADDPGCAAPPPPAAGLTQLELLQVVSAGLAVFLSYLFVREFAIGART